MVLFYLNSNSSLLVFYVFFNVNTTHEKTTTNNNPASKRCLCSRSNTCQVETRRRNLSTENKGESGVTLFQAHKVCRDLYVFWRHRHDVVLLTGGIRSENSSMRHMDRQWFCMSVMGCKFQPPAGKSDVLHSHPTTQPPNYIQGTLILTLALKLGTGCQLRGIVQIKDIL